MSGSTENSSVSDDNLLQAYKELVTGLWGNLHVRAASTDELVDAFVAKAGAANITKAVVTALFEELFAIGAIVQIDDGFTFLNAETRTSRFAAMIADEQSAHVGSLGEWIQKALTRNDPQPE